MKNKEECNCIMLTEDESDEANECLIRAINRVTLERDSYRIKCMYHDNQISREECEAELKKIREELYKLSGFKVSDNVLVYLAQTVRNKYTSAFDPYSLCYIYGLDCDVVKEKCKRLFKEKEK